MNSPPIFLKANAPVTVWLHIENSDRKERSILVQQRIRLGRLQVYLHGRWRNVPKRGHFNYADGAIGRLEIVRKTVDSSARKGLESHPPQAENPHVQAP